ncbi:MAG: AMP-binding protein [Chloroflexi bacterium]|nr:AMP-binding protein [Chloroflexota bacterium]
MAEFEFGGEIAWRPSRVQIEDSNLYQSYTRHGLASLDEFMRASVKDIAWFWDALLRELDVQFYEPYTQVVDLSGGIQFPQWCVGGKMNVVHNCLDKYIGTPRENQIAVKWEGEEGATRTLTYAQLDREVGRIANGLRALGLKKGDAIGVFMPMTPEIVVAVLAIAKIGAVFLPLFSGYGAGAAAVRLNDAGAKALFTADGTFRRGQVVPMKQTADEAVRQTSSVKHVIVLPRAKNRIEMQHGRDHWWDEIVTLGDTGNAETEKTDAEDLLMLIYTSGTTGKPKGAVHTHCGFPIKGAQDMYHGLDVKPTDTLFWMTDMGWMMGPWEVYGALLLGATMFLYDGAPDYPAPNRVWAMVERHNISLLGVSPTFVRALMKYGDEPVKKYSLESLRAFGSTGEPWNPTSWLWLFNTVGEGKRPIINYSGGTEISGGIVMGNFLTPQKPGSFAGPLPGIDADVVDEKGNSVRGRVGELVIRQPWIGMTRGFWKDPQRYLDAYWARFPNVWVHGDWAAVDDDGLWYILGRSDDVIKVAGKRLGPAEVESALGKHPAVQESAAIGAPDEIKGEAVVCFVMLKAGYEGKEGREGEEGKEGSKGTEGNEGVGDMRYVVRDTRYANIERELRELLVDELGKALMPKAIYFVNDLPRTRNAKIMRRVARAVYLGQDPGDISALENTRALEEIKSVVLKQKISR